MLPAGCRELHPSPVVFLSTEETTWVDSNDGWSFHFGVLVSIDPRNLLPQHFYLHEDHPATSSVFRGSSRRHRELHRRRVSDDAIQSRRILQGLGHCHAFCLLIRVQLDECDRLVPFYAHEGYAKVRFHRGWNPRVQALGISQSICFWLGSATDPHGSERRTGFLLETRIYGLWQRWLLLDRITKGAPLLVSGKSTHFQEFIFVV